MKVYVSGKISGEPLDGVRAKFAEAERSLTEAGYDVVNPLDNGLAEGEPWEKHLAKDLAMLMDCDAVCLLPNWAESRGARLERWFAIYMGKSVLPPLNRL